MLVREGVDVRHGQRVYGETRSGLQILPPPTRICSWAVAGAPAFRLFGFPVHVRVGFLMFLGLVVVANYNVDPSFALWLAFFMASLTLIHELGHAFAARATGANAEIALDFFYGYAAFTPTRQLKPWERAGISLAGPATQIALACAVLLALKVNPLDIEAVRASSHAARALYWAGPVIGLFNLIPVLPFDGGNVVMAGIDKIIPGRSRIVMLWFSVVVTVGAMIAVVAFGSRELSGLLIFGAIPLIAQLQMLRAHTDFKKRRTIPAATSLFAAAESVGWQTLNPNQFAGGQQSSPWLRAHIALDRGDPIGARQILLDDFDNHETPTWWPPDTAPTEALNALVNLLPTPLPIGHPYSEYVLSGVLLQIGRYREAAMYAADAYGRTRSPMLAVNVARGAAALADRATALAWLRTAVTVHAPSDTVLNTVMHAPEFERMRDDPQFAFLLDPAA